jgi:hypothetical protein
MTMSKAQTTPEKETEGHKATQPAVTRRFLCCTQSTGRVGKSTVAEGLITWLRYAEVPFVAIDADDEHRTLANRYPQDVEEFHATRSENEFHEMVLSLPQLPVTLVDFPAQSTGFLLNAFRNLRLLDAFEEEGIRPTFFIFASDDSTAMESASASVRFFLERADYLLVENPARFKSEAFKKTPLYGWLSERATPTLRLPTVTDITMNSWKSIERTTKTHVPLDEACTHPDAYRTVRYALANFRDSFLCQFEDVAVPRLLSDDSLIRNKVVRSNRQAPVPTATLSDSWL